MTKTFEGKSCVSIFICNKHVYIICNHDKSFYFTFDKDSLNDFVKYNACKQKIE